MSKANTESHTMSKKEEYRQKNEAYMSALAKEEGIQPLAGGVLYKVLESGEGKGSVSPRSIVTCHYRGSLISGHVFDDSWQRGCPEAFRANELIEGFQTALLNMHIGDHWLVYIPWTKGYGKRSDGDIPGFSTLVFEIQLIGIA